MRIGLLSDTHEARDAIALVELLRGLQCDLHVHLGDVGGAKAIMDAVREFKRSLGSIDGLNERQRADFLRLVSQGASPLRAYGEAVMGADPVASERRRQETQESYDSVLKALSSLARPYCLAGNVDRSLLKAGVLADAGANHDVTLVTEPLWMEWDETAVVLWPSVRAADRARQLEQMVGEFVRRGQAKRQLVVLAHEQLFKGPPPGVYKSRVAAKGLDAVTVPWFEPNPSWRFLIPFLRQLPSEAETGYAFGHVHDSQEVIEAGIPYLRGPAQSFMCYRLYGLGQAVCEEDKGRNLRRRVSMFYVPVDRVAVLSLGSSSLRWEVFAP